MYSHLVTWTSPREWRELQLQGRWAFDAMFEAWPVCIYLRLLGLGITLYRTRWSA